TVGSGDRLRVVCGIGAAFGRAGFHPARGDGAAQPASPVAGGGADASRMAWILGLVAMVGTNFSGGSLPALSGHGHGSAVEWFSGGSAVDRDRARHSAGDQAGPCDRGCRGQPARPRANAKPDPLADRGQSLRTGGNCTDADVHGASTAGSRSISAYGVSCISGLGSRHRALEWEAVRLLSLGARFSEPGMDVGISELVAGFMSGSPPQIQNNFELTGRYIAGPMQPVRLSN